MKREDVKGVSVRNQSFYVCAEQGRICFREVGYMAALHSRTARHEKERTLRLQHRKWHHMEVPVAFCS